MISGLDEFFKAERERVLEPSPQFNQRVMARFNPEVTQENGLWVSMVGATRPLLAALACLLILVSIQLLTPAQPNRGIVEAYLDTEISTGERLLYLGAESPPTTEMLEELVVLGDAQ